MRIHIELTGAQQDLMEVRVGNVYQVRGGTGARYGYMNIIFASDGAMATVLTVTAKGEITGATRYGLHYFEDKIPIAFVDGIEDIDLTMRSL